MSGIVPGAVCDRCRPADACFVHDRAELPGPYYSVKDPCTCRNHSRGEHRPSVPGMRHSDYLGACALCDCNGFTPVERGGNVAQARRAVNKDGSLIDNVPCQKAAALLDLSPALPCGCRYQCFKACEGIQSSTENEHWENRGWMNQNQ